MPLIDRAKILPIIGALLVCGMALPTVAASELQPELKAQGISKTKRSYLQARVKDCLEEQTPADWSEVDADELRQCILDSQVFSEAHVAIDAPVVKVTVKERWTVLPIPYVRAQRDSNRYGLFVYDSHFLGRGKQAVIGGSTGNRGNTLFALYRDPALFYGK